MATYRIYIEKKDIEIVSNQQSHEKLSDTGNDRDDGATYGYVPSPDKRVTVESIIYQQDIGEIMIDDILPRVVAAVNGFTNEESL